MNHSYLRPTYPSIVSLHSARSERDPFRPQGGNILLCLEILLFGPVFQDSSN